MTPDIINGLFELIGAIMIFNNCRVVYKEKHVSGVSVLTTAFFMLWGFWNVFYYPHLGQLFSFIAAMILASGNSLYVYLLWYYKFGKGKI